MTHFFARYLTRVISKQSIELLLAPGVGCTPALFKNLASRFAGQNINITYAQTIGNNIQEMAAANIDSGQLPRKFFLGGVSLGGTLAVEMARQLMQEDPERLLGLVCISTPGHPASTLERRKKHLMIETANKYAPIDFKNYISGDFFASQAFKPLTEAQKRLLINMVKEVGRDNFIGHLQATLTRPDPRPTLQELKESKPVILIDGEKDKTIQKQNWGELFGETQNDTRLQVISVPEACHLLPLEQPELLSQVFLKMMRDQQNEPSLDMPQIRM